MPLSLIRFLKFSGKHREQQLTRTLPLQVKMRGPTIVFRVNAWASHLFVPTTGVNFCQTKCLLLILEMSNDLIFHTPLRLILLCVCK